MAALGIVGLLFSASVLYAQTATLAWNANSEPNLAGYIVEYGTSASSPSYSVDVGRVTTRQFPGLQSGTTCYFRVRAYNVTGMRSSPSSQVSYRVPGGTSVAPVISNISPASGPTSGGTVITVSGSGFVSGATVRIGSANATNVTFVSASQLRATTPGSGSGPRSLQVINPGGLSASRVTGFTYTTSTSNPQPAITSVSPASGPTSGGTVITVSGSGFVSGATVRIGSANATNVAFVSASQLRATTPGSGAGLRSLQVTNPSGSSAARINAFTYTGGGSGGGGTMTFTSISPSSGPASGNTAITITGTNFVAGSGLDVRIGGYRAGSIRLVSSTQLTARTPAGMEGPKTLEIFNGNGQRVTLTAGFRYTGSGVAPESTEFASATASVDETALASSATDATSLAADADAMAASDADLTGLGADADGDGLPTAWEEGYGLASNRADGDNGSDGDPDQDGVSNLAEYRTGTHPRGFVRRYLAEGAVTAEVRTQFTFANPSSSAAVAVASFFDASGTATRVPVTIAPRSRTTLDASTIAELNGKAFATEIESDQMVAVDRLMWSPNATGAQVQTAAEKPAARWYLAAGSTQDYDLFYLLQNPGDAQADVQVRYLAGDGASPVTKTYVVAAHSRLTVPVNREDAALSAASVSAEVVSSAPIVAERSMYALRGDRQLAFVAMGTEREQAVPATSANRATAQGAATAFGGGVTAAAPAASWLIAEAGPRVVGGGSPVVLVSNAAASPVRVKVTLLFERAAEQSASFEVGAAKQVALPLGDAFPAAAGQRVSVLVESVDSGVPAALVVGQVPADAQATETPAAAVLGARLQ